MTLGKLIGLLLLFCLSLLLTVNVHTKNTRNELSCLVMGTIFLVYLHIIGERAKSETLSGLFNRESRYLYICHSTYVTFAL